MSSDEKHQERVDPDEASTLDASTHDFLVFKVAQDAKEQVTSWAKWIVGVSITILAILGFRTYSDFQSKIDSMDEKVEQKVELVLKAKQEKIDQLTEDMLDHYVKSLVETQSESKATIENSRQAAERVKTETKLVMALLGEYKSLIDKYKTEAETNREQLLALLKRPDPIERPNTIGPDVALFGELRNNTLGVCAALASEEVSDAYLDGEYRGAFVNSFVTALTDKKTDTNGDGRNSVQETFDAAVSSIDKQKYRQNPVLGGELKTFDLYSFPSTNVKKLKVRAVVIGINGYELFPLRGCVNDANQFSAFLKEHCVLDEDGLRLLIDKTATADGIKESLRWIVDSSTSDECTMFFFSGHLSRRRDESGSSPSGLVRTIVAVDMEEIDIQQIADEISKASAAQKIVFID